MSNHGRCRAFSRYQTARIAERITRGEIDPVPFDREQAGVTNMSGVEPTKFQMLRRAIYLLYVFSPMIVTAMLAMIVGGFRSPYWYRIIACAVSSSGAAFIKWGQWASTRPDMFPVRPPFMFLRTIYMTDQMKTTVWIRSLQLSILPMSMSASLAHMCIGTCCGGEG